MVAPKIMGKASPIRNPILWCKFYIHYARTYTHESSTQDAPALRTRGGGLKIFYDGSTLLTHPVPQTLLHNGLHCYTPWILSRAGNLQQLRQLLFKGVAVDVHPINRIYQIYSFGSLR